MHALSSTVATCLLALTGTAFSLPPGASKLSERSPVHPPDAFSLSAPQKVPSGSPSLNATPHWDFECAKTWPPVNLTSCQPLINWASDTVENPGFNQPRVWKGRGVFTRRKGQCEMQIWYPDDIGDTFSEWWVIDSAKWILEHCATTGRGGQKVRHPLPRWFFTHEWTLSPDIWLRWNTPHARRII